MAEKSDWQFPVEMRPRPEDWRFDLDGALDAVVQLRAEIPEDAFTAQILGTERVGNGVVIRDDGLNFGVLPKPRASALQTLVNRVLALEQTQSDLGRAETTQRLQSQNQL